MPLTEKQRAALEELGVERVRALLAAAGPGVAVVRGLADGTILRRDAEDWESEAAVASTVPADRRGLLLGGALGGGGLGSFDRDIAGTPPASQSPPLLAVGQTPFLGATINTSPVAPHRLAITEPLVSIEQIPTSSATMAEAARLSAIRHPTPESGAMFTVARADRSGRAAGVGKAVLRNRVPIDTTASAFTLLIEERIARLREENPNSSESIAARDEKIAEYEDLKRRVERFLGIAAEFANERADEATLVKNAVSFAEGVGEWWTKDHLRICRNAFDMGLFTLGVDAIKAAMDSPKGDAD